MQIRNNARRKGSLLCDQQVCISDPVSVVFVNCFLTPSKFQYHSIYILIMGLNSIKLKLKETILLINLDMRNSGDTCAHQWRPQSKSCSMYMNSLWFTKSHILYCNLLSHMYAQYQKKDFFALDFGFVQPLF